MTARSAPPRVLVLAALALGVGVLDALAITRDQRREAARTPLAGSLITFSPSAVHKLTLTRAGRTPMVLERVQGAWLATSHKNYPVRTAEVEKVLARLATWKRERIAGDKTTHTKFGVSAEGAIGVKLDDAQGRTIGELAVGTLTGVDSELARPQGGHVDPSSIGRCVRVLPDDSVYVVQDFIMGELEPEPSEWLERPTGGGDDSRVRALSISQRMGEAFAVHFDPADPRLGDGRPIDLDKARPLARVLVGLAPTDVISNEEDPRLGLAAPHASVEVALEGVPAPIRIILGDEVSGVGSATYPGISPPSAEKWGPLVAVKISGRPSAVFVQAGSLAPLLTAKTETLVLTHALSPRAEGVSKIELTHDGKTIVLAQEGAGWTATLVAPGAVAHKLEGDAGTAARTRAIAAATTGLTIVGFDRPSSPLADVGHGLLAPQVKIALELGRATHKELSIAAFEGDRAWSKRPDSPVSFALPAAAVSELVAAFDALPTN